MDRHRVERLANFKAERDRGIVHTTEWVELMAHEQATFNAEARARAECRCPGAKYGGHLEGCALREAKPFA